MDLLRIEALAMQGLSVENISTLLGLAPSALREMSETDQRIGASLLFGRTKGIELVSQSLFGSAISGKDASAARWWLERLAGGEFRPPRQTPVILIQPARPTSQDEARILEMEMRWERQRRLASGRDIDGDGNVVDLEPIKEKPALDDAESGQV